MRLFLIILSLSLCFISLTVKAQTPNPQSPVGDIQSGFSPGNITVDLCFNPDSSLDIGAAASCRPRDVYIGRNLELDVASIIQFFGRIGIRSDAVNQLTLFDGANGVRLTLTGAGSATLRNLADTTDASLQLFSSIYGTVANLTSSGSFQMGSAFQLQWSSNVAFSGAKDLMITRYGAGGIEITYPNTGKNVKTVVRNDPEVVTFAANPGNASLDTLNFPLCDGCNVQITSRVIVAGANCTGFHLGTVADPDFFGADLPVALNSTSDGSDFTAVPPTMWLANTQIRVLGTNGAGVPANCWDMQVRIEAHVIESIASDTN
jgi:hypothetical protein